MVSLERTTQVEAQPLWMNIYIYITSRIATHGFLPLLSRCWWIVIATDDDDDPSDWEIISRAHKRNRNRLACGGLELFVGSNDESGDEFGIGLCWVDRISWSYIGLLPKRTSDSLQSLIDVIFQLCISTISPYFVLVILLKTHTRQ